MNWILILLGVISTTGFAASIKVFADWLQQRKKTPAEIESIKLKSQSDAAKGFAESIETSVRAKAMAENIWKEYAEKLESKCELLEDKVCSLENEMKQERKECAAALVTMQTQINTLREQLANKQNIS